jgi:FAD/FMN-containing dehydrogenase
MLLFSGSGKSTGAGGLALWMHNMKETNIIQNYNATYYQGPAIRLGAGVLVHEAFQVAEDAGYSVVGGSCVSAGISGGYSQGGGHSGLSSSYGLAADNILEWEVVTAAGEHIVATPRFNSDLYWALSGGGGGTFAVVISMTARLHDDVPVGGAYLSFDNTTATSTDIFWQGVERFNQILPSVLD